MRILRVLSAVAVVLAFAVPGKSQDVGLKTNLLGDAALSPNLAIEIGLAPKWSLDLSGQLNDWTVGDDRRWKHWVVQPEARYWFCRRFSGHFLAAHALGGQFNMGHLNLPFKFLGTDFRDLKENRWQGWGIGAGVAYGYSWILDKHWNFEAEIGAGWIYTRYDTYRCRDCGKKIKENNVHNYVGLTKAALSIVYYF